MRCAKVRRFLSRYIDDELNKRQRDLVGQHLQSCPDCQQQLHALKSIQGVVRQKERVAAEEGLLDRIKDELRPQPQIIRIKWLPEAGNLARRLIPVPAVAMMIMFALLFLGLNSINPVDKYLFSDLTHEEVAILNGTINSVNLLINGSVKN